MESPQPEESLKDGMSTGDPPRKTRPVVFYLVIMFAVALCLILLSFMMQQRNHLALMEGLDASQAATQEILALRAEKETLKEDLEQLEQTAQTLTEETEALTADLADAKENARALSLLVQALALYEDGDKAAARTLLVSLAEHELFARLSQEKEPGSHASPRDIYDALTANE